MEETLILEFVDRFTNMEVSLISYLAITITVLVADYLTGLLKSASLYHETQLEEHKITSRKMRVGLFHKSGWVIAATVAAILDALTGFGILLPGVVVSCVSVELWSIYENLKELGIFKKGE